MLPELQEVVRALDGVAHATVRWPEPDGPATLHVVFDAAADRDATTRAVLTALREVGDVDLSTLAVQVPPPPAAAGAGPEPAPRSERGPADQGPPPQAPGPQQPDAPARHGPRPAFRGLAVEHGGLETAVVVTLATGERTLPPAPGAPAVVQSTVIWLARAGAETHVGSALARGDVLEAAVRATLDALNRRLGRADVR